MNNYIHADEATHEHDHEVVGPGPCCPGEAYAMLVCEDCGGPVLLGCLDCAGLDDDPERRACSNCDRVFSD